MPKRFLNIEYSGIRTRIDVTDFEDLSEVRRALKAELANTLSHADSPQLQFYDQQNQQITDLDDIPKDYYKKVKEGGLFLVVQTSPPPTRESSKNQLYETGIDYLRTKEEFEGQAPKRQCREISDLTTQLKTFANAQLVGGCIQSPNATFLPYPQDKIKKVYIRKCYQDVFDLLLEHINRGSESFAISGTPGIGKSLFFVYILYRLMDEFCSKSLSLKFNRIVYQIGSSYECFDLQQRIVTRTTKLDADGLVRQQDTFYVIDGRTSEPLISSCVVLFISSPRSEWYKNFMKQKTAKEWCFPVWTFGELQTFQSHCYPDLSFEILKERFRVCGGVARFVFHKDYSTSVPKKINSALEDSDAVKCVKYVGEISYIFPGSHSLLQILVGDDEAGNAYQFIGLDVASKYVGEQLWLRSSAQMLTNLQEMFGGSPNEISRHLFEIYGHMVFSVGGQTLKCRCLESGTSGEIKLDSFNGIRNSFGRDTIPSAATLEGKYYEATHEDSFPAVDSLSPQGMFQFTVAAKHPIRGVQILRQLCELYKEPKLYFVVPPHQFEDFEEQKFADEVKPIAGLKQYVLELPVMKNWKSHPNNSHQ